jgi:hypothetical protein
MVQAGWVRTGHRAQIIVVSRQQQLGSTEYTAKGRNFQLSPVSMVVACTGNSNQDRFEWLLCVIPAESVLAERT